MRFAIDEITLWSPENITTSVWLDASVSSNVTIETGVSQLNDMSGNNRHATQTDGASQPDYVTNVELFNNLNALYFNYQYLSCDLSFLAGTTYSIFIVMSRTDGGTRYIIGGPDGAYKSRLHTGWRDSARFGLNHYGNDLSVNTDAFVEPECIIFNPALSTQGKRIFKDGTLIGSDTRDDTLITNLNAYIGRYQPTGNFYKGNLGEMIILDHYPTDDLRYQIEGYLAWKWGTVDSLPPVHPFKYRRP